MIPEDWTREAPCRGFLFFQLQLYYVFLFACFALAVRLWWWWWWWSEVDHVCFGSSSIHPWNDMFPVGLHCMICGLFCPCAGGEKKGDLVSLRVALQCMLLGCVAYMRVFVSVCCFYRTGHVYVCVMSCLPLRLNISCFSSAKTTAVFFSFLCFLLITAG